MTEQMVVLGPLVPDVDPADLHGRARGRARAGTLYEDDDHEYVVWQLEAGMSERRGAQAGEVAVLGVGMHPWGKWGRNFVEYGVVAAQAALADAGVDWRDIQFVSGADTMRNGYPGYVAGATFAQALGWQGAPVVVVATPRARAV